MPIKWSDEAINDLDRFHRFMAAVNHPAADRIVQMLTRAPDLLLTNPRIGEELMQFAPREIRRFFALNYEIRYELQSDTITILRLWHTRESR